MGVFTFGFRDNFNFSEIKEGDDYPMICMEFNKMVDIYYIKPEIYSEKFWKYLTNKYNIVNEGNILTKSDIDVDEKNRIHKKYRYVVKCEIQKDKFIMITFNDEKRCYDDADYHSYVSENDKSNKVYDINIYYDSDIFSTKDLEDTIVKELLDLVYLPSMKNQFFTINSSQHGYNLKSSYIKELEIDLELNYGKKFVKTHDKILSNLKDKKHGLFLFHGEPGTGKTSYIRKLISLLSEKKTIVYIPSYMMHAIADPELISFISNFRDTILLLEDAESVLTHHADERTQAVSNILNMTDGLLNDTLEIQIISTFNIESRLIDPALTRAGRLLVNHKFGKLTTKEANKLSKHIGSDNKFSDGATLSEIYEGKNQIISDDFNSERTPIGFKN